MRHIVIRPVPLLVALALMLPAIAMAQTKTTDALQSRFEDAFSLYFYKNTLRMLNQQESKEYDELIKNIQKMKFLMIDKIKGSFEAADYKKLKSGYQSEKYEEMMTIRHENKNFDVYMKEKDGATQGTVILVNDSTNLYVLDILGSIDVGKATKLFSTINESSDFGKQLKNFVDNGPGKHTERGRKAHVD